MYYFHKTHLSSNTQTHTQHVNAFLEWKEVLVRTKTRVLPRLKLNRNIIFKRLFPSKNPGLSSPHASVFVKEICEFEARCLYLVWRARLFALCVFSCMHVAICNY